MCLQGDAVFWYNLKRSGKGDYETEHAACPVLCGNKWGESLIGLVPTSSKLDWSIEKTKQNEDILRSGARASPM